MGEERDALLDRLGQEYLERLRRGERATPEEYCAAHPDLASDIIEVFPVLALMEGLGGGTPPSTLGGSLAVTPPTAPPPDSIGAYRVIRELGRGGMGVVYEVRDEAEQRLALKLVHSHLLERPGFLARFLRELDAGLRIDHPGVVRTIESGVAELDGRELPYLVLEFVEGETLRQLLDDSGPVSERLAREIGVALASALDSIHDAGVIHRDLKPENVVITADEQIKLMDLGVALVKEEALRLTQTGEFVGSLLYAAPEQLRSQHLDGRADLYALGLLLFELLAGRHPESGGAGLVLARRFDTGRAPQLRSVVPSATDFFEAVLEKLLEPDRLRRFESAADVVRVLREGEQGEWWRWHHRAPERSPAQRFVDAPPFAGRSRELAALDAAWEEVLAGRGQVRVVRGEAGLGKSRLVAAWLEKLERRSSAGNVVWVEHAPGAGALGLTPIARGIRALLGEEPEERVRLWLGSRADRAGDVLSSLTHGEGGTAAGTALDSSAVESLYILLLRGLAVEAPLMIVVEDLHFATGEGQELFERFAHAFRSDPVLLLGTTRPSTPRVPRAVLLRFDHVAVVELAGLDTEASFALLQDGLEGGPVPVDAARGLIRKSDGNPYCLVEFARALRTRRGRMTMTAAELELPGSIREVVEERLDALDSADRDLLGMAACGGFQFDPVLLCEAAAVPRLQGLRALHRLEREQGLVVAEGAGYRFQHHLVHEVLRDELPPALRETCHAALGESAERRLSARGAATGSEAFEVARHLLQGDEPSRALPYVRAGLDYLMTLSESRRAARMAERALVVLDLDPALRTHVLLSRGKALTGLAQPIEVLEVFEEALISAREAADQHVLADVFWHLGGAQSGAGRHDRAAHLCAQAVRLAEELDDQTRLGRFLSSHAWALYDFGEHERAIETAERALVLARAIGDGVLAARTAADLAALYVDSGHADKAEPMAELALATSQLHGVPRTEEFALRILAKCLQIRCDPRSAHELLSRAHRLARDAGLLRGMLTTDVGRVHALMNLGELDKTVAHTEDGLAACRRMDYRELAVLLSIPLALCYSLQGQLGKSWDTCDAATTLLEDLPLPALAGRLMPVRAQLLTWFGDHAGAEDAVSRGVQAAKLAGAPRSLSLLRQVEASALDAHGRTEESAVAYAAMLAEYREGAAPTHVAMMAARLGGLLVRLDRADEARPLLEEAISVAEPGAFVAPVATSRIWLALLPGGNLSHARIALERDARLVPARARLRLLIELARRSNDDALAQQARELAGRLVQNAPQQFRAGMQRNVPLYSAALP